MGWLASFFSPDKSQNSRKGQALSSTHDAFSLPTSSPVFSSHPDAFNSDALNTPEPDSAMSPPYTYPPQGSGSYGYVPTSASMHSRPTSLLPIHHDQLHTPLSPSSPYPPLSHTWNRIRVWLTREYPELGDTLNYGILPQDLAQIEMQFGFALPAVVRESYLAVDGQEAESAAGCSEGLFFGLTLLPLESVLEEWRFWREVDDDPTTGANHRLRDAMQSIPPGWVRKEYSQRGWIPLIADKAGNYIGIDLNPGETGSVGQVLVFGREFDTKVVLWKGDGPAGWAKWLASFVEELESGEGYELGAANDGSDGSEDDLGYESYFYDGSGRGQGDGGGDTGAGGGLRLTGEYRGWNVLEAWADRSLRKWHESGVISDASLLPAEEDLKGKGPERVGLGVIDLTHESAAEIVIPVLSDADEPIPPPPTQNALVNVTNTAARPPSMSLPTISVTKPPAPLPVALPTANDIAGLPSPPESTHSSFDEDLESGRSHGMREISRGQDLSLVSPSKRSPQVHNAEEMGSALASPVSPQVPLKDKTSVVPSTTTVPPLDLLTDLAPTISTKPIQPSSPATPRSVVLAVEPEPPVETPKEEAKEAKEAAVEPTTAPITDTAAEFTVEPIMEELSEEVVSTDTTVRLVGGGGTTGIAAAPALASEEETRSDGDRDSDVASVTSVTSESNKAPKKHKKTMSSLASLKKLGHLGGKRKKDSGGSAQDLAAASSK